MESIHLLESLIRHVQNKKMYGKVIYYHDNYRWKQGYNSPLILTFANENLQIEMVYTRNQVVSSCDPNGVNFFTKKQTFNLLQPRKWKRDSQWAMKKLISIFFLSISIVKIKCRIMDLYVQNLTNQNVSYLNIIEKIWFDLTKISNINILLIQIYNNIVSKSYNMTNL